MAPIDRALRPEELQAFSSEIPGVQELRRWCLYDRSVNAVGVDILGDFTFFSVPIGQAGKTLLDTNMRQSGQLPARQGMEVWDIGVHFQFTGTIFSDTAITVGDDVLNTAYALLHGASLTFRQAQKVDLEIAPVAKLCPGFGPLISSFGDAGAIAGGAGFATMANGHPSKAALWDLSPLPIVILPQRSFSITLNFPVNVAVSAAIGVNIWLFLDGILHRSA